MTSLKLIFTLILTAQTEASCAAKLAQSQHSCMSLWVRHVRTQGHEPNPTSMHVIMGETTGREHCQDVSGALHFQDVSDALHCQNVSAALHCQDVSGALHCQDMSGALHCQGVQCRSVLGVCRKATVFTLFGFIAVFVA